MKKSCIEHVKKYSMLSLVEDLGFTLVYESSNYYHLEEHDSLKIRVNINRFYWYSKGFGGDTITLCQTLGLEKNPEFHCFIYTILYLEMRMYKNPHHEFKKIKRQERKLYLPRKDINNKKVYYYLYERGINLNIIDYFIDHDYLYQEAVHHNLVFVSYKGSQPVFISKRGSVINNRYMREQAGNDYNHCFYISHKSSLLIVTESIIDMMSLMTLTNNFTKYDYLSLNSVSHYRALFYHLEHQPIERVLLRLDNDQAGRGAVHTIVDILNENYPYIKIDVAYPYRHKDWNDYLVYGINHKDNDIIIF